MKYSYRHCPAILFISIFFSLFEAFLFRPDFYLIYLFAYLLTICLTTLSICPSVEALIRYVRVGTDVDGSGRDLL